MPKVAQDLLEEFGRAVEFERSRRGWKLNDVASRISEMDAGRTGLKTNAPGRSFLSDIEKGKRSISASTVGKLIHALEMPESWLIRFLDAAPDHADEETPQDHDTEQLIAAAQNSPAAADLSESLLIAVAYGYAHGSHRELKTAYDGLRAALESAAELQRRAELPQNTGAQVDAVMRRMVALNREGRLNDAALAVDAALSDMADEELALIARKSALLDLGVDQDRRRNDPGAAAKRLYAKLRLEAHPGGLFNALRRLALEWSERGSDQGISFDAEVAVHLARSLLDRARGAGERSRAQLQLGYALRTVGERDAGPARLHQAVAAHKAALADASRQKSPQLWAACQHGLGTALVSLGEHEARTATLQRAVAAFRASLRARTQTGAPREWAETQNGLGIALSGLGDRSKDTELLDQAIAAHDQALLELTRDRAPPRWASAQHNRALALARLGRHKADAAALDLAALGFADCLLEWTCDAVPYDWAMTQWNLADLDLAYFDVTRDPARLVSARATAVAARAVFQTALASHQISRTDDLLAQIAARG